MSERIKKLLVELISEDLTIKKNAIEELKKEKDLSIFMQPHDNDMSKIIWEECALILAEKTDDELLPYIKSLLEWLQDGNWPGFFTILERLEEIPKEKYQKEYNDALKEAYREWVEGWADDEGWIEDEFDNSWLSNLKMIDKKIKEEDFLVD